MRENLQNFFHSKCYNVGITLIILLNCLVLGLDTSEGARNACGALRKSFRSGLSTAFWHTFAELFDAFSADDNGRLWQPCASHRGAFCVGVGGICELCADSGLCGVKFSCRYNSRKHKRDKRAENVNFLGFGVNFGLNFRVLL